MRNWSRMPPDRIMRETKDTRGPDSWSDMVAVCEVEMEGSRVL